MEGSWTSAFPLTAGDFTAAGYYFGLSLYREVGVLIGLINATGGGTPVESWIPSDIHAGNPAFAPVAELWQKIIEKFPPTHQEYLA